MSQEFIDPEVLSDFFVEAKEHLETIEPNLLELENNPSNLGLLNDIFRPMHSLKGASGFLGLNKINRLAHKTENILDELRQGGMSVNQDVMDLILSATDLLRSIVDNLEETGAEGDVDVGPTVDIIEELMRGGRSSLTPVTPEPVSAPEPDPIPEPAPVAESVVEASDSAPETEFAPTSESAAPAKHERQHFVPKADPNFDDAPYPLTTVGEGHLSDFLEEARDIIDDLNRSLLELEKGENDTDELVNDIFRYFHNLKGNSGIIGFRELNSLTHEAETLLNRVRKGEMATDQPLIDLLLSAVDFIETLIGRVEPATGDVAPLDTSRLVEVLQKATEDGEIPLLGRDDSEPEPKVEFEPEPVAESAVKVEEPAPASVSNSEPVVEAEAEPEPIPQAPVDEPDRSYDPEDVEIYESTSHQQIDNLNLALSELRKDAGQQKYVDGLYRTLRTVENSAGYMGVPDVHELAGRTAGLVNQARSSDMDFSQMLDILKQETSILTDKLLNAIDEIKKQASGTPAAAEPVEAAAPAPVVSEPPASVPQAASVVPEPVAPQPAPVQAVPAAPPAKPAAVPAPKPAATPATPAAQASVIAKHKTSSTIRVDHQKLDHLMNLIGELIINRNRYALLARALEEGQEEVHEVAQQLTETTYAMARISDDLQDTIMNVRMVPVQTVFSRFPRLVRDLSRKSGKQIELMMEGEETELDKSVVEEIGDPLVHLVRNAVDHGLEGEEERIAAGKAAVGHVWLRAYHKGNSVAVEVEDDGRGIDPDKMRLSAVRKKLITQDEANNLDDREATELIFMPGFSSAEVVTDISGRGVGMDVVKTNIKNLKGSVHIQSEVGKGSKLTLTLPLTLAIIDALMVEVAGETFALPLDAVSETTKIRTEKLSEINGRKAVTLRGEVLGVVELAELLELPMNDEDRPILPVVIVHDNDRRVGLVVDRLLERQEIVIKPLGQYLSDFDLDGISGATIMGDGSVVLILDPHEVYSLATNLGRPGGRSGDRGSIPALKAAAQKALEI